MSSGVSSKEGRCKPSSGSARRQGPGEGEVQSSWQTPSAGFSFIVLWHPRISAPQDLFSLSVLGSLGLHLVIVVASELSSCLPYHIFSPPKQLASERQERIVGDGLRPCTPASLRVPPAGIQKEQSLGGVCSAAVIPGEIRLPMLQCTR